MYEVHVWGTCLFDTRKVRVDSNLNLKSEFGIPSLPLWPPGHIPRRAWALHNVFCRLSPDESNKPDAKNSRRKEDPTSESYAGVGGVWEQIGVWTECVNKILKALDNSVPSFSLSHTHTHIVMHVHNSHTLKNKAPLTSEKSSSSYSPLTSNPPLILRWYPPPT